MSTHLPPQEPIEPDDALPGEAELSALYRQLSRSEPGPALDAAVLRAAAAAIASGNRQNEPRAEPEVEAEVLAATPAAALHSSSVVTPIGKRRPAKAPRWLIGLASAATLVLVAGVAWHMREMPNVARTAVEIQYQTAAPKPSTVVPAAREGEPSAPLASAVVPKQQSLPKPAVLATESKKSLADTSGTDIVASAQRKSPSHIVPATALVAQSRAITMPPPVEETTSSAPVSTKSEADTSAHPQSLQTEPVQDAPAPPAPALANAGAFSAKTMAQSPAALDARSPSVPAPATPPAPAPAIAEAPSNGAPVAMAASSNAHAIVNARRPVPMPAPMPAPPPPPTPPPSTSSIDTMKQPGDSPAQELAKITALFAQHNDAEAQRRLRQFHRDHPTWNLDPPLRARLGEP